MKRFFGVRDGIAGWVVILLAVWMIAVALAVPARAGGLGEMSVTWHMVDQEELNRRCAVIGRSPCKGLADWSTGEIWTLPPSGVSDPDILFVIMHELSHLKMGCYHGADWNYYLGPEFDADKCAARRSVK